MRLINAANYYETGDEEDAEVSVTHRRVTQSHTEEHRYLL